MHAQTEGEAAKEVTLKVCTISARNEKRAEPHIDSNLERLSSKLKELPYDTFTLKSSEDVVVPVEEIRKFILPDNHELSIRLLYLNHKRLGIWLEWKDEKGMSLLNTRLHLNCTEPVIAGTESSNEEGLVLAVSAERH